MKWWKQKKYIQESSNHHAYPDPEELLPSLAEKCFNVNCQRKYTRFLCVCGKEFVCSKCGRITTPNKEEKRMIAVYAIGRK